MLTNLRLFGFRNFDEQRIEFSPGANIFVGHNGQGKSNILEALYLLLTGGSFRAAETGHFVKWGQDSAAVRALFSDDRDPLDITMKIQNNRKSFILNEKKMLPRDWARLPSSILFSPESLNSIKGSADERRRLIDEVAVNLHPEATPIYQDFRKSLRMRNQILKQHLDMVRPLSETQKYLDALNQKFLELASQVIFFRLDALQKLAPEVNMAMQKLSAGFPEIQLQYWISKERVIHATHKEIHILLSKRMQELALAELAAGNTLVGPHKHDIIFLFGGNDSRFFCSQGQQRSLILAFKLAQIVYHQKVLKRRPILLLDDVLSELDGEKRTSFIELLKGMESQIVMTTTDYDLPHEFASSLDSVKRVHEGRVII